MIIDIKPYIERQRQAFEEKGIPLNIADFPQIQIPDGLDISETIIAENIIQSLIGGSKKVDLGTTAKELGSVDRWMVTSPKLYMELIDQLNTGSPVVNFNGQQIDTQTSEGQKQLKEMLMTPDKVESMLVVPDRDGKGNPMPPREEYVDPKYYDQWVEQQQAGMTKVGEGETIPVQIEPGAEGKTTSGWMPKAVANYQEGKTTYQQGSPDAMNLVNRALSTNSTTNLQQYDWWNNSPYKQEAWNIMNDILSSPEKMAQYVKEQGFTNLQQYDWWSSSPYKSEAWGLIESGQVGTAGAMDQGEGYDDARPTIDGAGDITTTGATSSVEDQLAADNLQAAIDYIMSDPNIPPDLKSLYVQTIKGWSPDAEINMENVMTEFNRIKEETIDPYFANEVIAPFVRDIQDTVLQYQQGREQALETERTTAGENIRQAKEGLEKAGMTFTGKGIETLGAESAYAQPGAETAIPTQTPFADNYFYEGTVNQANRLMASSSQARYQKALEDLGKQAESQLGTAGLTGVGLTGYAPTGGITGNIEEQKQQQLASTLSQLAGQNRQVSGYQSPIDVYQ